MSEWSTRQAGGASPVSGSAPPAGGRLGDFEAAGRAVLAFLHRRLGFGLWMLTRTEGDDWIVLQSEDHGYGVAPGKVFRWTDSFCYRMVSGEGPRIAPSSELVPAYAAAPIGRNVDIRAYVGVPIRLAGGELFGTLCAIDPQPQPEALAEEQELIELCATLLSTILQAEMRAADAARAAERLEAEALGDELTGVFNRRGWERLLVSEEERCRRFGHPAAVVVVDLDGLKVINDAQGHAAGDDLLERAACALRSAARAIDVVARLGGDEFGVLGVECDPEGGQVLLDRIRGLLAEAGVEASAGLAQRDPAENLDAAWQLADRRMYEVKRAR